MRNQFTYIMLFSAILFMSACGTRKVHTAPAAAKAKAISETMSNLKSKPLYRFINDWYGVNYRLGGLDKKGIDCSGFAFLLQKEIYGKSLPRRSRDQANAVKNKELDDLKEGDLVFFSFGGREVDHVGIYLNNGYFVHASTSRGIIVDDLSLPAYKNVFIKSGSLTN